MASATASQIATRAVYASAYPRGLDDARAYLTHAVDTETGEALCRKVKPASLMDDEYATDPSARPTCPTCARRDPRTSTED